MMQLGEMYDNVLMLSPHTDDVELGAGGLLSMCMELGKRVVVLAFSCGSSETGATRNEFHKSMDVAGVNDVDCHLMDFPARRFLSQRQEILDAIVKHRELIMPSLVVIPSVADVHQDHQVVHAESKRAFGKTGTTIISYGGAGTAWHGNCFARLHKRHIDKKIEMLGCYETQRQRSYMGPSFTYSRAIVAGVYASCEFAEMFEVVRWIA